ncbi:MAG: DUF4013 domain-containing protein [Roseiflexaceae bacterium]|nr:DUF4013 domain-containing protein [Roseiflexaceae bacterium]
MATSPALLAHLFTIERKDTHSMDIGKAFGFVTEDEKWISKVLIGGLVLLVPIVNFALFGYALKVAENVARGDARPLPEWSEFGDLFMRGLYFVIISVVYQLPTFILYCVLIAIVGGAAAALENNPDSASGGAFALLLCLYPLIFILAIVGGVLSYIAAARYIAKGTLAEAFKFGEVFATLRNNLGKWVIFFLVVILAGIVGQLGIIACGIGVLFTGAYAYFVIGHALGQTMIQTGMVPNTMSSYSPPTTPLDPPPAYQ